MSDGISSTSNELIKKMVNVGLMIVLVLYVKHFTFGNILPKAVSLTRGLQAINIKPLNSIGLIALPINFGCSLPTVNDWLTCAICNRDCIYVHNTYGGKCGPHPKNPKEFTCLCAHTVEDARKRDISLSSKKTCRNCLPSALGTITDDLYKTALVTRMHLLQCPKYNNGTYEESGCITDCQANHGVKSGYCDVTYPLDPQAGDCETLHCECSKS